ncbi:hypothetical protein GOBAR_DD21849 [Gossypium barbadense]|nr:hypothetical protein GOBAR_DD21849 [Gossypium barbadense]
MDYSFDDTNFQSFSSESYSSYPNINNGSSNIQAFHQGVDDNETPLHAQDHVIAERKRREKLSQRFISLSALIPGLKKTDKASVLGDAIKYMKQLQEEVATLEEQAAKKATESLFPEIEARVSDKDVLIRIHCEKNKGFISNIMNEVEKLHLCVWNTNVLPFGQATLDITIVAQMEAEFSMTVKDLVKSLRLALLKFM